MGRTEPSHPMPAWPRPLQSAALIGLLGELIDILGPHTEADPSAIAVQYLIGFGNIVGRGPHFPVEADAHRMNEFCVLVGETSSSRKGTSLGKQSANWRPRTPSGTALESCLACPRAKA